MPMTEPGDAAAIAAPCTSDATTDAERAMIPCASPATGPNAEDGGTDITRTGLRTIYEQFKAALDDKVAARGGQPTYAHRCARADLRRLLDLIELLENRHGIY